MKRELAQPFVKWVGGKRQLMPEIRSRMPKEDSITTYYEPFLGGGAVFLDLQPIKAVVNDYNSELINAYQVIQKNVEELIEDLSKHENTEAYYYDIRAVDRTPEYKSWSNIQRASRLIYLNKTGYNGLYRVNSQGFFNTPYGRYKNPNIKNENVLRELNAYFNESKIKFLTGDFEEALKNIRKGAFVYFDPPYAPLTTTANFTGYTQSGFDEKEQIRLKKLCDKLNAKGVKFLLSNSKVDFIEELYKDYIIEYVSARRNVNSIGSKRGEIGEVLIRNYDL
ncbi:DNA adenine methylase [Jeotgalibaca caeni]|uniref:DNA adenine methylase n=1 Tax=Jeotgalibaca caeni TaxID=3028623 RepID=UPI00237EBFD5|nr:DNA adenine methylase [Jeotgalibaca caeni]MDE1549982.1 DNA adenine methylase [Jeotgalibaca caeni]